MLKIPLEIESKMEKDKLILKMSGVLDISTVELLQNSINHLGEIKKLSAISKTLGSLTRLVWVVLQA